MQQRVIVGRHEYLVSADEYGRHLGDRFEPWTAALLEALCEPGAHALDVGANVGITALLLGSLAEAVAAIEPVPGAFARLQENAKAAANVSLHNFAMGAADGTVPMQGYEGNLSGSFIADKHHIHAENHFTTDVPLRRLDDVFPSLGLGRLDFVKVDVEGCELDVLEGGRDTIKRFRPVILLEMNHVALNLWRRISLPEFRERLLEAFPCVYAVHEGRWVDLRDERGAHDVLFSHLTTMAWMDVVVGFDQEAIQRKLQRVAGIRAEHDRHWAQVQYQRLAAEHEALQRQHAEVSAGFQAARQRVRDLESSSSWRVTAPLRAVGRLLGRG